MDENLFDQTTEEKDEMEFNEVDIPPEDIEQDDHIEEIVYEVVVEQEDAIAIDVGESMGWVSGDNRYHDSLLGIDFPRQHPIEAITNLREELDEIERLKPVYSDKFNVANYYEWKDAAYNIYGYFVSLVPGTSTIKLCDGANIFGVSVDDAGFIGGQDEEIPRDSSYGLIVTSGLVDVRCELDVEVGDHVVSNADGYAKKSGSDYGYRVLARENKHGIEYAVIALGVQADVTNAIGVDLDEVKERVEVNEKNIISAINVANQAYNKAESASSSASVSKDAVEEALKDILGFGETLEEMEKATTSANIISAQAKAIAESAATSAASMKNEAVERVNEALAENTELRKEFEAKIAEIDAELDSMVLGAGVTKEELESTRQSLQDNIDAAVDDLEELAEDLEPLATWPEGATGDNIKGIAGFVAQSDEDSATLASIVAWKGDAGDSLAGFVQTATAENAEVKALAEYTYTDKSGVKHESVAALDAYAKDNESSINLIAGVDGGLAGLQAQVNENAASVSTLASHIVGDYIAIETWDEIEENNNPNKIYYKLPFYYTHYVENENRWVLFDEFARFANRFALDKSKVYYVMETKEYWYYQDEWVSTDKAYIAGLNGSLSGIQQISDSNAASIEMITNIEGEFGSSLTTFVQETTGENAEIRALAEYGYIDENGKKQYGAAGIMAEVDKNKSSISAITSHEFTKEDGTTVSGLAGLQAQVDNTNYQVDIIANRVAGQYKVVPELVSEDKRNPEDVYYSKNDITSYWYHSWNQWNEVTRWNDIPDDHVDEEIVYYIPSDKLYWYYNYDAHAWNSTSDAYDAGLPSAIAGIQNKVDDNSASINSFTDWQGAANVAMARIEQKADANGAYIQSTVANIDKYSVGENSQAHGFTLEQAAEVLEEDQTYYIPIKQTTETYKRANEAIEMPDVVELEDLDASKVYYVDLTTRKYIYYGAYSDQSGYTWFKVDSFDDIPAYTRTFLPGYLYKWGRINGVGHYGWTTVDKDYATTKETSGADNTSNVNTSSQAVYFSNTEILLNKKDNNNNYGYWYTQVSDGDETIYDSDGNPTDKYQPYTLYKWDLAYKYKNEDDVDIKEYRWNAVDTLVGNSTGRAVSQIRQDANSIKAEIVSANGSVAGFGAWLSDTASEVQTLSTWAVDTEDGIKYNLATIKQKATDAESSITQVVESVGKDGKVNAASIVTAVTNDTAAINMLADNITLTADQITLTGEDLSSFNATIGGWNIDANRIYKDSTKLISDNNSQDASLLSDGQSPIRLAIGSERVTREYDYENIPSVGGIVDADIDFADGIIVDVYITYLVAKEQKIPYGNLKCTIDNDGRGFNIKGVHPDYKSGSSYNYAGDCIMLATITYINTSAPENEYNFRVLDDGSLYANAAEIEGTIKAKDGDIGGWEITKTELKKGNTRLIADDTITGTSLISGNQSPIRLAIGSDSSGEPPFRVLDDGSLYAMEANIEGTIIATEGQIGQFKITNGEMDMSIGASNLVLNYNKETTHSGYHNRACLISPKASPDRSWDRGGTTVGYLVPGKKYTIQIDLKAHEDITEIGLYHGDGNVPLTANEYGNYVYEWIKIPETSRGQRCTLTKTFYCRAYTPTKADYAQICIYQRVNSSTSGEGYETTIYRVKIEEGSIATSWDCASDDLVASVQDGSGMHWRMLPSGCYWWNENTTAGTNSQETPLMRLDSDGLYVKGEIEATSGKIAGWNISEYQLSKYMGNNDYGFGMSVHDDAFSNNKVALAIGTINLGWDSAAFRVTGRGDLYASNATITGKLTTKTGSVTVRGDSTYNTGAALGDGVLNLTSQVGTSGKKFDLEIGSGQIQWKYKPSGNFSEQTSLKVYHSGSTLRFIRYGYTPSEGSSGASAAIVFENGMSSTNMNARGRLEGTWQANECLASGSDANYKNSIESFDERYYQFFKNLVPRRYKYNHGTSDRYHMGFVAQEVENALLDAGLTTQEVAAYIVQHCEGEDDGMCALRYEEFIALVVDALQRALKRIDALEAKYETQITEEE